MFYALHRVVKLCAWLLVVLLVVWLWRQREALEPVRAWYDVYENGGLQRTGALPRVEGKAVHIYDGHSFQMESDNKFYSVRLTGLATPEPPLSPDELTRELKRREMLKERVLLKPVQVDITYSNQNSYLGIVHQGGTNLNLFYLTNGLGTFKPEYIKTSPREVQYKFFSAARWRENMMVEQRKVKD